MIWIRADGGREIGMGHIMRCLSIAGVLQKMGERVCFLVADDSAVPFLEGKGVPYQVLCSDYRQMEEELPLLPEFLESPGSGEGSSMFLVDSYYVTAEYLSSVGRKMPVAWLDDMGRTDLPVDLLINYNIFAEDAFYKNGCGNKDFISLTGTGYVPLRQEFGQSNYQVRNQAHKVLITTGGSDRYNLAGLILTAGLKDPRTADLEYCVVSGAFNENLEFLENLEEANRNVHVYRNVTEMAILMEQCDIAVTAGGSTMYELSAVGVPMLCFSFVDNQEKIVEGFRKKGIVCFGGDYLLQGQDMIGEIINHISMLREDAGLRADYSRKQQKLVDGRGAERIARELLKLQQDRRR